MENWLTLLQEILEVCIIPLLGILTTYLVMFIKNKAQQISENTHNELRAKYIMMLSDTITTCVIATNQTYVDNLKKDNAFTKEAQLEALQKTFDAVLAILTEEAQAYLSEVYGDLNAYIMAQIEATVKANKEVK